MTTKSRLAGSGNWSVAIGRKIRAQRIRGYGKHPMMSKAEDQSVSSVWAIRDALGFLAVSLDSADEFERGLAESFEGFPDGALDEFLRAAHKAYGQTTNRKDRTA